MFAVVIMGLGYVYLEFRGFRTSTAQTKRHFIESQKSVVKAETEKVVDLINFRRHAIEEKMRKDLRDRIYQGYGIMENLYRTNKNKMSHEQIKQMFRDVLRPIRFNNGRGYFFLVSMDGTEELYPIAPQFEGKNLLDLRDEKGNYVIRDEINLIKKEGEGFVTDFWTKPGIDSVMIYPKTSFIKLFEPMNLYIGCGEYLDNIEKDIQEEVKETIRRIRFGSDGYIFVNTYDGHAVIIDSKKFKPGDYIWEMTDAKGLKVIQEEYKAVQNPGGGFINYHWKKLNSDVVAPKISFIKGIKEWKWMVGAGIYVDEIDQQIASERKQLIKKVAIRILLSFGLLIIILLVVTMFARWISRSIDENFEVFMHKLSWSVKTGSKLSEEDYSLHELRMFSADINEVIQTKNDAERIIIKDQHKLKELNDTKDKYFSIISHDLQGPFNTIIGFSDILLKEYNEYSDDERRKFIANINHSAVSMHKLLINLLTWARSQSGKIRVNPEKFSLHEVAQNVVDVLKTQAGIKSIDLANQVDVSCHVFADKSMTSTIIQNLTSNAVKFTGAGGCITINAMVSNNKTIVTISDTGIGIKKESLEKIFELDDTKKQYGTDNETGTGLGLVICKEFVEKMQENIWAESVVGKGTTFYFTLEKA